MPETLCADCGQMNCSCGRGPRTYTRRGALAIAGAGVATAFLLAADMPGGIARAATVKDLAKMASPTGTATMAIFGTTGPVLLPNFTNNGIARAVTQCFGSSLLGYNSKTEFIPQLASSYTLAKDGVTYTFHLRKNTKWSDGKPFVAHDLEAAIIAMSDPSTVTNWISYVQEIEGVTDRKAGKSTALPGVKVVDDNTLQVTLIHPSADFLDLFGTQFQPIPSHITDSIPVAQLTKDPFALTPNVGIGPFALKSKAASGNMTLVRNAHYWDGPAHLKELVVEPMTSDNGVTQLISGSLDVVPGETIAELNPNDVTTLKANKSITVTNYPNNTTQTLYMNIKTLFPDVRVRQAVAYALDRAGMIKTLLDGKGQVANSVYPTFSPYYNSKAWVKYTQNVSKAKKLLAEAKWDKSTSVELLVPTGDAVVTQAGVIIQQQLSKVGMKTTISQVDSNTGVSRLLGHQFQMALFQNVGLNNLDVSRRFATASYNGGVNAGGYSNPKLDSLMAEALTKPTLATQKPLTNQIQKIISEDVPTVMLWYRDSIAAVDSAKLRDVKPQRGGAWLASNEWTAK